MTFFTGNSLSLMFRKLFTPLAFFLLLLFVAACSFPLLMQSPLSAEGALIDFSPPRSAGPLLLASTGATATPTPFQPMDPTPAYEPTRFPTGTPDPQAQVVEGAPPEQPTVEPTATKKKKKKNQEVPDYGEVYQRPDDQVNILLLGSDQRTGDPSFRTDVIILATLNPSLGTVNLTSFPRDLYITIPAWGQNRINTVFGPGSFELMAQTFEYNFGVRPDHYVMVNFEGFKQAIDSLDGIDVDVGAPLTDWRPRHGNSTVEAGLQHMNGDKSLWYVRSRKTSNDFDRTRRQQEVITGLFNRVLSLDGITRAPELFDIYKNTVQTDLKLKHIQALLPLALTIQENGRLHHYYIGSQHVYRYIVPGSGADVLLPDQTAVMQIIHQAAGIP